MGREEGEGGKVGKSKGKRASYENVPVMKLDIQAFCTGGEGVLERAFVCVLPASKT